MRTITKLAVGGRRPRVEGAREAEILSATLDLLTELGYDRLTMDAVAARARAGKATLYRRWAKKSGLVVDAILSTKIALQVPDVDTGNLREDLLAMACGPGGLVEARSAHVIAAVVTGLHHDPDFAAEFRARVIGPKAERTSRIFDRARARGEITADLDVELLAPALAGIVLHRDFVLGLPVDRATIERVVDQIILPAATRRT